MHLPPYNYLHGCFFFSATIAAGVVSIVRARIRRMTAKNGSTALVEVKGKNGELVEGYDYSQLDAEVAKKAKAAAKSIRLAMKKTVTGLIEIGQHLLDAR
jgi:hypothetical protein